MIKFFRKIRQNLLSEGKTGKYFKYAIGEIILVVFGILIALSINNWNENRKTNLLEMEILKEVSDNLNEDFNQLELSINRTRFFKGSYERVLDHIHGKTSVSDSLKFNYAMTFGIAYSTFSPADSGYESLKSLGVNTVKNDEIRKEISKLYGNGYKLITDDITYYMDNLTESYSTFQSTLYGQFRINKAFQSAEPINLEKLQNNIEYKNQLKQIIFLIGTIERRYISAQSEIRDLDNLIKKELESRK